MSRNPRVHIIGDWDGAGVKRAQRDLGVFERQAAGFSSSFKGSMLGAGAALGGAFAVTSVMSNVVDFMREAGAQAVQDQKSFKLMEQAFINTGNAGKLTGAEEGIQKLSRMVAVADDDLRPALQTLVTATGDVDKSQGLLQTALDASAATGRDLTSVVTAIAKSSTGQVSALRRLGIPLDDNIVKTKNFDAAIASMNDRFRGQAATAASSYEGRLKSLSIAADEAKERVGYSLLRAVDNTTNALGGTSGANAAIELAGQLVAGLATQAGLAATNLAKMARAAIPDDADASEDKLGGIATGVLAVSDAFGSWIPVVGPAANVLLQITAAGVGANSELEKQQAILDTATARWEGLANQLLPARARMLGVADATEETTEETDALKAATDALSSSFDRITSRDDVVQAIRAAGKAAKEAKGDLKGMSDASIDLRSQIATAATAVLANAQLVGTNAQGIYDNFVAGIGRLKSGLVANGIDAKVVDRFIDAATWQTRFQLLSDSIGRGQAAAAMRYAGLAVGRQMWKGMVAGLAEGEEPVNAQAQVTAGQAAAGARYAAQINSPSKVWAGIGSDMALGLAVGLRSKASEVDAAARIVAGIAIDAGKDVLKARREEMMDALGAVKDMSAGIRDQVLGNLNFATTGTGVDGESTALTPEQIVQAMFGDIAKQGQVVDTVAAAIGKNLPPALLQQILAMPPDTAIALANYFGANPTMLNALASEYQQLGTDTETLLGQPMGLAWAAVGDKSAKDMLAAARDLIAKRGDSFSQWVSSQLAVTIPVGFSTSGMPHMADGGIVTRPTVALIGEAGPEAIVPLTGAGSPAPMAGGGTTVYVTVQAPVGADLRRAGQEIAEALAAFEGGSGPIYVRAS